MSRFSPTFQGICFQDPDLREGEPGPELSRKHYIRFLDGCQTLCLARESQHKS
jgi:hypothetical protein